jgi:predicted aspartyl protease
LALLHVSRRQFLKYGTSSLALASFTPGAKSASSPGAASSAHVVPPPEPDALAVAAATDAARLLRVPVQIDGNGPYHFVVDTGADRSVLCADIAADLGLLHGGRVMMEGVVRAVGTDTVRLRQLSFGPVACKNLLVPVLPRSMLHADGYLGLDTLDGHRVTFDFKNHTLQVSEPRSRLGALWVRQDEARIRTTGSSGHLRAVDCFVDGVAATAFIDTGAEMSAGNTSLLAALTGRRRDTYKTESILLTDITGGELSGDVIVVNKIQLMELQFTGCPLVIADFQIFDVWGLRGHPALLIGMNFLRQFPHVSIDYGLKELRFDLAKLAAADGGHFLKD